MATIENVANSSSCYWHVAGVWLGKGLLLSTTSLENLIYHNDNHVGECQLRRTRGGIVSVGIPPFLHR